MLESLTTKVVPPGQSEFTNSVVALAKKAAAVPFERATGGVSVVLPQITINLSELPAGVSVEEFVRSKLEAALPTQHLQVSAGYGDDFEGCARGAVAVAKASGCALVSVDFRGITARSESVDLEELKASFIKALSLVEVDGVTTWNSSLPLEQSFPIAISAARILGRQVQLAKEARRLIATPDTTMESLLEQFWRSSTLGSK